MHTRILRPHTGDVSTPTPNDGKVQSRGSGTTTYEAGKGLGYVRGQSSDFNAEFALDEAKFWQFLSPFRSRLRFSIGQTLSGLFTPVLP